MRALVIATDGFGGHGGIALYVRNMITALCSHPRVSEVVALPRVVPFALEPMPSNLQWRMDGVGGKVAYARALARLLARDRDFDLVVCTHLNLLPLAHLARLATGAPLVEFVYGTECVEPPPAKRVVSRHLIRGLDALITIRNHTTRRLDEWIDLSRVPIHLLENALDLDRYGVRAKNPALVAKYGLDGKTVILTLGRVEEQYKGFDEVLEAMPRLLRELPNLAYVIAGDGPDLPRIKEKARALGVIDHVVFAGMVADAEKADHYRLADAFVMPGRGKDFDRYPLRFVFLEAMACGVPVVGSRVENEQESRDDGALLAAQVDPDDLDDIARGIVKALAQPRPVIPPGLQKFSFPSFERRWHAIVDAVA